MYSIDVPAKSSGNTGWFGMNFSASALGVSCVWMKIVLAVRGVWEGSVATVWHSALRFGLFLAFEDVMAGILVALWNDLGLAGRSANVWVLHGKVDLDSVRERRRRGVVVFMIRWLF